MKYFLLLCTALYPLTSHADYLVGAGRGDITGPAAEVGMMGYAKLDQQSAGIHQRLSARAFVFADTETSHRVVFVSADLGQVFQSIKQGVVKSLRADFGNLYTDKNIMLSATHTHSGPGGFAHEILFNVTTYGFVQQNYEVIVKGIVNAIKQAHENLEPAKLFINRGELTNASKNRSIESYLNNPEEERKNYPYPFDTRMTLLKIISETHELGMINWFALHGVSMSNKNHLISGDNKGFAAYLFERDMGYNTNFVAAFAQSNEGDVSPNIDEDNDDFHRTMVAGIKQYQRARTLYDNASETINGTIDYRLQYVNMADEGTCPAALGYSFAAGTSDGKGADFFEQGMLQANLFIDAVTSLIASPSIALKQCQSPKPILLAIANAKPTPWVSAILPVQIFKLGNLMIIGVPGEFTTMAGRRLRNSIKQVMGEGITDVVIAGLANAYSGYITTREEYAMQHYEGGFTLFGPNTLSAYQQIYAQLSLNIKEGIERPSQYEPEDRSTQTFTLQTPVLFDDVPMGKHFGDTIADAKENYHAGEQVNFSCWGGHPKNNLHQEETYLSVEMQHGDLWETRFTDRDWDTIYRWQREGIAYSSIHITWNIPNDIEKGIYRIRHFGDYKYGWNGNIYPYICTSRQFVVN